MTKLLYIIMVMDENSIRDVLIWGERQRTGINDSHGVPIRTYGLGTLRN